MACQWMWPGYRIKNGGLGLVSWAPVIAMLVQGDYGVVLSPTHNLWVRATKTSWCRPWVFMFMWFARQHYCGDGWQTQPQGHLQAGLHSPTSSGPFATTRVQPNQSIQHPWKLSIPSHSHLPNLMFYFPSLSFLFPEGQSFSPFTMLVYTSTSLSQPYLSFKRQLKYYLPPEAFLCCPPSAHVSTTFLCWAPAARPFAGCWAHPDKHRHWLNLSKWIEMSFIRLWLRSFLLSRAWEIPVEWMKPWINNSPCVTCCRTPRFPEIVICKSSFRPNLAVAVGVEKKAMNISHPAWERGYICPMGSRGREGPKPNSTLIPSLSLSHSFSCLHLYLTEQLYWLPILRP